MAGFGLNSDAAAEPATADLIITNVKIYRSPSQPVIDVGSVWLQDGNILRVEAGAGLPNAGADVERVDGRGRVLTAGYWNSHVHFSPPTWTDPGEMNDAELRALMERMLIRWGFTTVVDTGSDPRWTDALERRLRAGLPGPRILRTAGSFVGKGASPAYLDFKLPELETPEQARKATAAMVDLKPQGIKIFTGSFAGPGKALHMTQEVVDEITKTAHGAGLWVMAHPQSLRGMELAVNGGVDILAHTAPDAGRLPKDLVRAMVKHNVALIPTLQLWRFELSRAGAPPRAVDRFQQTGVDQLRDFASAGGEVLFGTDVGYMTDLDPTEEYQKMTEAGLGFRRILTSLTTAPARRFDSVAGGERGSEARGTITPGEPADLVLLASDPATDPTAFARPAMVFRNGLEIYSAPTGRP